MDLYIDISEKKLVQSATSNRSVYLPTFMQGDNEPLIIHLLEKGTNGNLYQEKVLDLDSDTLKVAIARFSDEPRTLTYASTFTLNEQNCPQIILPLNTTAIEQALENKEYISAYLEVEISNTNGNIQTVLQTSCRVKNDLIEDSPTIELLPQFYNRDEVDTKLLSKADDSILQTFLRANATKEYLETVGACKENLNLEYTFTESFTYMFTYINGDIGTPLANVFDIFQSQYYETGDRLAINFKTKKVSIFYEMDWDTYAGIEHYDYDLNADVFSGDKISVVYDSSLQNLKIYINKTLASDIDIGRVWTAYLYYLPKGTYLVDTVIFKNALGLSTYASYDISDFVNGNFPPSHCYENVEDTPLYNFPSNFTGFTGINYEAGLSFQGEDNCLKVYPTDTVKWQSGEITDVCNGKFVEDVFKKITMKVYYPTTNVHSSCVNLVSARDFVVYPKDEWQTIEFYKSSGYADDMYQYVSFRNEARTNFAGSGTGDDDVFYIANIKVEFDARGLFEIGDLKETDYAIINKAYNNYNNLFSKIYPLSYPNSFIPKILGDKPIVLEFNTSETLNEILGGYMGLTIGKIEIYSDKSSNTPSTLHIGSNSFEIPALKTTWQFLDLKEVLRISYSNAIGLNSEIDANLTLRLYVWK